MEEAFFFDMIISINIMTNGFFELGAVMILVAGLAFIAKILRQPLVLAYIIAGFVFGYLNVFNLNDYDVFHVFANLGIMFLLFLVGLDLNYGSLRVVGKTSLIIGLVQIVFTSLFGFLIARWFDFNVVPALYIAIALTFSSTIIVLKILSERRDLHSLYGKISVGFLLVQDFVAVLLLIFLSGLEKGGGGVSMKMLLFVLLGTALSAIIIFIGRKVLPVIFDSAARSQELLFLVSLAWVFAAVGAVKFLGFSIEMGGFLAGLALANSSEHFQIGARFRPLRDFFIVAFFVLLGSSVALTGLNFGSAVPVLVFSLFVLIGNPVIVFAIMAIMGYRKRTSFFTGLTVAQISEFSLILMAMGLRLGHVTSEAVGVVTFVGIITITASTYLMTYADFVFKYLTRFLSVFERKRLRTEDAPEGVDFEFVLVGCHRMGQSIVVGLPKEKTLVIDFDPGVIKELDKHGFNTFLGDIADPEISEVVSFQNVKLIISTSPDFEDNLTVLSYAKSLGKRGAVKIVLRAEEEKDAWIMYDKGADYVIMPHFTAGQYFGKTVALDPDMSILERLKERDLLTMKKIAKAV